MCYCISITVLLTASKLLDYGRFPVARQSLAVVYFLLEL